MAISPAEDGTLVKLLQYLKTELNQRAVDYYTAQGETTRTAVDGLEIGQTDLAGVRKFPLLNGWRRGLTGEEFDTCACRLRYFILTSVSSRRNEAAFFTWVAKRIAIALKDYSEVDESCLQLINIGSARFQYTQVTRAKGPVTIPYLEIDFTFEDYEPVA